MDSQKKAVDAIKAKPLPSPDLLSKEDIETLLPLLDEIIGWAKKLQEYSLKQALSGIKYEGFKVVEGRSSRKLTDPDKALEILKKNGFDPAILFKPREMLPIGELESLAGKKKFAELLGNLVEKSPGKPTLVTIDDKRPEFNVSSAKDDFKEVIPND